ncbi:MAG TPA: hypothetical protein VLK84_07190 [Longimicrobium sp.]|nr:hypothetical protein [Longimicrobium sp.]
MKTLRFTLALVAALLALPSAAGAQDPQQRIDAARQRAEAGGIPVALLDSKVAEGRAKGVPMDRIAGAVERRLATLSRARDAMAGAPRTAPVSAADLSVGADALEAGVEPAVLGRLTVAAPGNQRAQAIAMLAELVAGGESSDRALARVTAALSRGPEALRNLPGEAASERGRGNAPPGRGNNGRGNNAGGRGRGQGGPPASVPGPAERPGRDNPGKGNPGKGKP